MSDKLPETYWDLLGENGLYLKTLLDAQTQQVQHLQRQNEELQKHFLNSQNNLVEATSNAAVAAAQRLAAPAPPHNTPSIRTIKAADPERFSGNRAETEGFIRALRLSIAIQPECFPDERTKLLYALSFMTGGSAQIWAHNQTEAIISGTSYISSLDEFIDQVEEIFGDPDRATTARTKLHNLRMSPGMSADEYTAQFDILAARTGFNDAALEDAYSRGLPAAILDKIHAQPSLPYNLRAWKETACQIDRNHRRLLEMKRGQAPHSVFRSTPARIHSTPITTATPPPPVTTDTSSPMDIDSSRRRVETRTCYRCGQRGHISPNCPQPPKPRIRANLTEADIAGIVSEKVAAALDAYKLSHKDNVQTPANEDGKGFQTSQQ
jgi:Zinc knuckle